MSMAILGPLMVYSPSIVCALALAISVKREPRQFRNAIYLGAFLMFFLPAFLMQWGREWMLAPLALACLAAPLFTIIFLFANTVIVVRHEGLRLATLLPALLACVAIAWMVVIPFAAGLKVSPVVSSIAILLGMEGLWFFFSFVALLLYSQIYRLFPRKRHYQYIVIHGTRLIGTEPTPLLRGRIEKAVQLWERQGRAGYFVASGGQGTDEVVSEAEAIGQYLREKCGVPAEQILLESRSTTTRENLAFSARVIVEHVQAHPEERGRVALVTSDYHVFRASEYAHQLKLAADGVGSHTRAYYWPTAFIREFVAITKEHLLPYFVIVAVWVAGLLVSYVF